MLITGWKSAKKISAKRFVNLSRVGVQLGGHYDLDLSDDLHI